MTTAKERLFSYLPWYYGHSKFMDDLLGAEGQEIDRLRGGIYDFNDQQYIETATWALDMYEELYGLSVDRTMPIEERRRRILARKRTTRADGLLNILRSVEPDIEGAFGRLYIPLYIPDDNNHSEYGRFNELIRLLEEWKPAAYSYTLTYRPPNPKSGFTMIPRHLDRHRIAFAPESGTVYTGRWPYWQGVGETRTGDILSRSEAVTGTATTLYAGMVYSGPVKRPVATGAVDGRMVEVNPAAVSGDGRFGYSGDYAGTIPDEMLGSKADKVYSATSTTRSGNGRIIRSGTIQSGEVVN